MAERQWKPGDLVDAQWPFCEAGRYVHRYVRVAKSECHREGHGLADHWHNIVSNGWASTLESSENYRPLVVIDPEDRGQIERLWRTWTNFAPDHRLAQDNMQAALREFANPKPPKPDEPTGLGAVVEDDQGDHWVRINITPQPEHHWRSWWGNRPWAEIAAVRVLSEGVQP